MRFWIAALPAAYFLFFFELTGMGLVGPDEPRYAWIGRAMAQSGDWVTPRLWGEPWFEKPALLYWMTAAGFGTGLGDDWAPRLPAALLSMAFLLLFYFRLKAEFSPRAAGYASAVLATSAGWVAYSHAAVFDLPLSAAFGAAMLLLLPALERPKEKNLVAFAALLGISALAKGLVGPVLAGLTLLCWTARRGTRLVRDLARPWPLLAFAATAVPWFALCYARNGPVFLEEFFWRHHFARYLAGALEHNQPLWYFLPVTAGFLLPWTPLVALLGRAGLWREPRAYFLASWAAVTLVFFSLSQDKLPAYVLPALPALAALAGIALADQRPARVALVVCAALLALAPAAAAGLPTALESGLLGALKQARFSWPAFAVVAALCVGVWAAERAGRRAAAVAGIALCAVAGYAWIKHSAFPAIDRRAGTRTFWRQVEAQRDSICLGQLRRHVVYGLSYYAGRRLPSCEEAPMPLRVESDGELTLRRVLF
ncbi:MAG: glycosyltransferase family 39 protein [Acidobacteria bacterium]|nr:glycosyltransferase family 39 protein [Acidobacteriota bacterium]